MSGLSDHAENAFANALRGGGNGVNVTAPAALYAKLHTGDPGEAWRVDPDGPAETKVEFTFDRYLRFDEAAVMAGDSVVVSFREKDTVSLPPGAVYEAQFVLILDEV